MRYASKKGKACLCTGLKQIMAILPYLDWFKNQDCRADTYETDDNMLQLCVLPLLIRTNCNAFCWFVKALGKWATELFDK